MTDEPVVDSTADEPMVALLTALLAVQAAVPTLPKDKVNPHFHSKFTPLDTIVETVGPVLNRNGLVWMTFPCRDDSGAPALRYCLAHAPSGGRLEGTMPLLLTKSDPQGLGSALTYARRYSLCAVLNLVSDDDDDGNAARQAAAPPVYLSPEKVGLVLTAFEEAGLDGDAVATFLKAAGVENTRQMTAAHARELRRLLDDHLAEEGS